MSLTLIGAPHSTLLLDRTLVKSGLGVTGSDYDTLLDSLIYQATYLVYESLGYSAFRCTRRETLLGSRAHELVLSARPVLRVDAASYRGVAIDVAEVVLATPDAGIVSRDFGFQSCGDVAEWRVDTLSGWFLIGDNVTGSISVSAGDNSYNSSALFPEHLTPGDWLYAGQTGTAFSNAANNGYKRVLTATTSKITVEQTLVTEGAATHTLGFKNVPAELERAALEAVRVWFRARTRDPAIKSKSIDDVSITYSDSGAQSMPGAIERSVAAMLFAWRNH